MTRDEIVSLSDRMLLAAFGTPFAEDPITPIEPGGLLDIAADDVCKATDCFYDVQKTDLVAGQGTYSAPTIYRVKDVYAIDVQGNTIELIVRTPADMTRLYGAGWRDWTSTDPPQFMVWEGTTKCRIAPVPSVSRTGALCWEGFATTTSKILSGVSALVQHLWPGEGDECPLPEDGQMAVVYRLCALRCLQQITREPSAIAIKEQFDREYMRERNQLEADSARRYRTQRVGPGGARVFVTSI